MEVKDLVEAEKRRLYRNIEINKNRLAELELMDLSKWGYKSKGMYESSIYEAECSLDFISDLEKVLDI